MKYRETKKQSKIGAFNAEVQLKTSIVFKKGFTLLELLVVVGILAALVALSLPFYQDYVNQSKLTAAEADLNTFAKALAMYDQMEPEPFSETTQDLRDLIGKYLQDFRSNSDQLMPIDPWSNDYMFNVQTGAIWSMGPNGTDDTLTDRVAGGDDILATWKPDFFINGAKRINNRVLEISFSRKVDDSTIAFGNVTVGGAPNPTSLQKISATIFRVTFDADLASTDTITVADTVEAIDGRTLATAEKPDGSDANTITY